MQTFTKEERLCSRKIQGELFLKGASFAVYPFRVIWMETALPSKFPVQLLISVPKKNIKKATDRNNIKRLLREVYRKEKNIIYSFLESKQKQCAVILIYIAKNTLSYQEAEQKTTQTLNHFIKEYEQHHR